MGASYKADYDITQAGFHVLGDKGEVVRAAVTFLCFAVGITAMMSYAILVWTYDKTSSFDQTVLPVALHLIGVGVAVGIKTYYDISKEVGYLESMALIIRSR